MGCLLTRTLGAVESRDTDVYGLTPEQHIPETKRRNSWRLTHAVPDPTASLARKTQAKAPAGTVLFFSEATIHSAVSVLSERTRYAMFVACTPAGVSTRYGWRPKQDAGVAWSWDPDAAGTKAPGVAKI